MFEQIDENVNASYETLSKILQTFISSDSNLIAEKILTLMEQTSTPVNTTLLDMYLVSILSIQDISIQIRTLTAISLINPSTTNSLPFLPGYLKVCFKADELISPALRCVLNVMTEQLFLRLKSDLERIALTGSDTARKLCLHIFYRLYQEDSSYISYLLVYIKRALFDLPCKPNAFTIISEVVDQNRSYIRPLVPFLINEVKYCGYVHFTKLTRVFVAFAQDSEYKSKLETALLDLLESTRQINYVIEISKIAAAMESDQLIQILVSRIDRAIQINKNPNLSLEMAKTLHLFGDKYHISRTSLLVLLQSPDYNIISQAMPLQTSNSDTNDSIKIVNDMIVEIAKTGSPHLAEVALQLVPHHGDWFVTILFELYNMKLKTLSDVICKAVLGIKDPKTQSEVISEARKQFEVIPDDQFGIAIAELISRTSSNPEDFFILLPSNINYKSPEFQASMVSFVFEFWQRAGFEIDTSMMNRLMLLSFSSEREVRQRALELITMIKSKS